MTVNEKMGLVINLAEKALALFKKYIDIHKESPMTEWVKSIIGQGNM